MTNGSEPRTRRPQVLTGVPKAGKPRRHRDRMTPCPLSRNPASHRTRSADFGPPGGAGPGRHGFLYLCAGDGRRRCASCCRARGIRSATTEQSATTAGCCFALFLVGWGLSLLWGPMGDRFGRVRTLTLTILCYSVFTFAGALATNVWQLAVFRLLAGIGIGGEWTLGGTFVAEEWPEDRRKMGAGYMHNRLLFRRSAGRRC